MIQVVGPPTVARETNPGAVRRKADAVDRQILLDRVVEDFAKIVGNISELDASLIVEQYPRSLTTDAEGPQRGARFHDFLRLLKCRVGNAADGPISVLVPQHGPSALGGKGGVMDRGLLLLQFGEFLAGRQVGIVGGKATAFRQDDPVTRECEADAVKRMLLLQTGKLATDGGLGVIGPKGVSFRRESQSRHRRRRLSSETSHAKEK